MKITALYLLLIVSLHFGCKPNSNKPGQISSVDSALIAEARRDSLNVIEEKIAIGNINFGISEKEFEKQKAIFEKKCQYDPEFTSFKRIGDYDFYGVGGLFRNDSLYSLTLEGKLVAYGDYDHTMPSQHTALFRLLSDKYGGNSSFYGLPSWTSIEKHTGRRTAIWEVGQKKIEIVVYNQGLYYRLNTEVFIPKIENEIKAEGEREKSESIKKGTELL